MTNEDVSSIQSAVMIGIASALTTSASGGTTPMAQLVTDTTNAATSNTFAGHVSSAVTTGVTSALSSPAVVKAAPALAALATTPTNDTTGVVASIAAAASSAASTAVTTIAPANASATASNTEANLVSNTAAAAVTAATVTQATIARNVMVVANVAPVSPFASDQITIEGTPPATATVGTVYVGFTPTTTCNGTVGNSCSVKDASGNTITTPLTYTTSGSIPAGLSFDSANGTLTGTPTMAGNYSGTLTVSDGISRTSLNYTIAVSPANNVTTSSQSIGITTFTPTTLSVSGTSTISATATSGLAVTFSSTTPSVCTVSGTTVSGVAAGTCIIAADQNGNATYNAATQVTQNITVWPVSLVGQSISTITFNPATLSIGSAVTVSSTATSGLAVTFTSTTPSICTVIGNTVTGVAMGICTIAANQAGNATYSAANQITNNITDTGISQSISTITFSPTTLSIGSTATVSAASTSGLTVTFSSTTPSVCTVSGNTVTGIATGTCTISANQAGDATYGPANQITQNITDTGASQSIGAITFNPATLLIASTSMVSATATSGLDVTFSSTTPSICTLIGNTVTGIATGTCTIAANQAGNANYIPANQITQNITVTKQPQTISTLTFNPTTLSARGTTTVSATATSGLAVKFSSITPSVCTVSGSTVRGVAKGICTIAANQAGNATYSAAGQITQNITGIAANQSIGTIAFNPTTLSVGSTTTVSATATSDLVVTFSATTPSTCTVSGNTVAGVATGTCTIAANQSGDDTYSAANQVTQNITVTKQSQTIDSITFNPTTLSIGSTATVSATATSGLAVTFSSTTPSVCTVTGSSVTGVSAGTCTIAANQVGNATYGAASQITQNITNTTASQSLDSITFNPTTLSIGGTTTVSATATSGLAVTFSSTIPSICTVSGNTVTGVATGTCTISANQAGNATYSAANQITQNITVGKGSQSITFGSAPSVVVGGTGTVSATGGSSSSSVTFSSTTTDVCTISGTTVTGVTAGTCTIAANQVGDSNYTAAPQVTQNITVGKGTQSIGAVSFNPSSLHVGGTTTAVATASSGLTISFNSTTTGVCTVSGTTVSGVAVGTCTITADQAGDSNYNAATQATQDISVGKGTQTITFATAPFVSVAGGTGVVSATSTSGLAVTFSSTTTNICTISGSTVTGIVACTCTIAANQAGNSNWNAATQVTQDITVQYTINDTGITTCSDASSNGNHCPMTGFPGQDAEFGRDANSATNSDTDGHAGFKFTKIDTSGGALDVGAGTWSCIFDNVTGLMWEVKTNDGGLRYMNNTYTWYNPDSSTNGGNSSTQNGGICTGSINCDTYSFVQAVNTAGLCGHSDWRMPTMDELTGIADLSVTSPTIDTTFFPNTPSSSFWSSSPYAWDSSNAWDVVFSGGNDYWNDRSNTYAVRLVRVGQ